MINGAVAVMCKKTSVTSHRTDPHPSPTSCLLAWVRTSFYQGNYILCLLSLMAVYPLSFPMLIYFTVGLGNGSKTKITDHMFTEFNLLPGKYFLVRSAQPIGKDFAQCGLKYLLMEQVNDIPTMYNIQTQM